MWAARPIVEKHDRYAFYRPVAEMLASLLCSLPLRLVESILFQIPLYFMTNLRRTPGAFFTYWLFMFATVLTMAMLFRMVGTLSRRWNSKAKLARHSATTLTTALKRPLAPPTTFGRLTARAHLADRRSPLSAG